MDSGFHLKNSLKLSKRISEVIQPLVGVYRDEYFEAGKTGDATYEIDEPIEEAVTNFFKDLDVPVKVYTEDMGELFFGDGKPEAVYLIDPLDGSRNARRNLPFYSTSIAVYEPNSNFVEDVSVSVVARLDVGETFHAVKGGGAYLNDKPISKSGKTDLLNAIICVGSHFSDCYDIHSGSLKKLSAECRGGTQDVMIKCLGSTALELAYLACGRVDMVLDMRSINGLIACPKTYDIAAGILLCREGGADLMYGSDILPQNLVIDPKIPVSLCGAGSKRLFNILVNTLQ